jgi:hypothetical protein
MTIRKISDLQLGSIGSTKVLTLTSTESLYTISSGMRAVEFTNHTSVNIYYGQSNLLVNSGGIITQNNSKVFDTIVDNFRMYFVVTGGTTTLVAQEYLGQ